MAPKMLSDFLALMQPGSKLLEVHVGPPRTIQTGEVLRVNPAELVFEWRYHGDPAWVTVIHLNGNPYHWTFGEGTATFSIPDITLQGKKPYVTWFLDSSPEYKRYMEIINVTQPVP